MKGGKVLDDHGICYISKGQEMLNFLHETTEEEKKEWKNEGVPDSPVSHQHNSHQNMTYT